MMTGISARLGVPFEFLREREPVHPYKIAIGDDNRRMTLLGDAKSPHTRDSRVYFGPRDGGEDGFPHAIAERRIIMDYQDPGSRHVVKPFSS